MSVTEVIIRIHDASRQKYDLQKIVGNISLSTMIEIIGFVDLEANPRLARKGRVTDDIQDSLATEPELFQFMTKGVLIAASSVEELDRNRFRLRFEDPQLEGILDGGHNTLAAGRQILTDVLTAEFGKDEALKAVAKIRSWQDLKDAWQEYGALLLAHKDAVTKAQMPIEVIFPGDTDAGSYEAFQEKVLVINAARNNNAELSNETKHNKQGYYEDIRDNLDPLLKDEIEWKTNDGGRIKVRELVSLALIPLSVIPLNPTKRFSETPGSLSIVFSSKGQCVEVFKNILDEPGISEESKGNLITVVDPRVKSALGLMRDMPRLFDLLYEKLPYAYNAAGGSFGKIKGVDFPEKEKDRKRKWNARTHYYRNPVEYTYGDGYFYPLLCALSTLVKIEGDVVSWKTDPYDFINAKLVDIMKSYISMIQGQGHDPAKVGKIPAAYNLARNLFESAYKDDILKKLGLS